MKLVLFGGFLMLSGSVIIAGLVSANGSGGEIACGMMLIGALIGLIGLIKKDK